MTVRPYRIQVAAQVSGVNEGLIRAWERRYGVLNPARTASGYRTYSEDDIEVLKRLKQLTEQGVSISQAASLLPGIRREIKAQKPQLKLARADQVRQWREAILVSAEALDQPAIEGFLDEALRSMTPLAFYEDLIAPLMTEVGDRWHQGALAVPEEHLITVVVRDKLGSLLSGAPRRARHHVVCACPSNDSHELGLLGAALHFRHAGWRVTFLGAKTPAEHLATVVRTLKPEVVALSLVEPTGAAHYLNEVAALVAKETEVVIGGQGARQHSELIARLGFEIIEGEAAWTQLLGRTR